MPVLMPFQLEWRKHAVFASESAALLGLSPWATAHAFARAKLGLADAQADSFRFRAGHAMEPLLLAEAGRLIGKEVHVDTATRFSPTDENLGAHLDGYVTDGDYLVPVEAKTVEWGRRSSIIDPSDIDLQEFGLDPASFDFVFDADSSVHDWGDAGTDEVPDHYLVQVTHQAQCTCPPGELGTTTAERWKPAPYGYLIAGFGYSDAKLYRLEIDPQIVSAISAAAADLMAYVRRGELPPPKTASDVCATFPAPRAGVYLEASPASRDAMRRYVLAGALESAAKKAKDAAKDALFAEIGDAEGLLLDGAKAFTAKRIERSGYTVAATSYRSPSALKPAKLLATEVRA